MTEPNPLAPPGGDSTVAHPARLRTHAEFTGFFAGLDLLDPGVVLVSDWRPDPGQPRPDPHLVTCYGAVGRTP